jgi:hypothetical protein
MGFQYATPVNRLVRRWVFAAGLAGLGIVAAVFLLRAPETSGQEYCTDPWPHDVKITRAWALGDPSYYVYFGEDDRPTGSWCGWSDESFTGEVTWLYKYRKTGDYTIRMTTEDTEAVTCEWAVSIDGSGQPIEINATDDCEASASGQEGDDPPASDDDSQPGEGADGDGADVDGEDDAEEDGDLAANPDTDQQEPDPAPVDDEDGGGISSLAVLMGVGLSAVILILIAWWWLIRPRLTGTR